MKGREILYMTVWAVEAISDFEYGCRKIRRIFYHYEDAVKYIGGCPDKGDFTFWDGTTEPMFIIEGYDVVM